MATSPLQCTKTLIRVCNKPVTPIQVQKILYLCHAISIGTGKGELVYEPFEAWKYGPVLPSLYKKLKMFRADPVFDVWWDINVLNEEDEEYKILDDAGVELSGLSAAQLMALTHRKKSAWYKTYHASGENTLISNEDIEQEYKDLCNDYEEEKTEQ